MSLKRNIWKELLHGFQMPEVQHEHYQPFSSFRRLSKWVRKPDDPLHVLWSQVLILTQIDSIKSIDFNSETPCIGEEALQKKPPWPSERTVEHSESHLESNFTGIHQLALDYGCLLCVFKCSQLMLNRNGACMQWCISFPTNLYTTLVWCDKIKRWSWTRISLWYI